MALDITAIIAFTWIFSFLMCFSMGANDESMGSAYGSKAFSLRTAIIIGSIAEVLGAVVLGSDVAVTIQGKLFSVKVFQDEAEILMLVFLCALAGAAVFLIVSSYFGLPVSTTHAIVGAVTGVAITAKGFGIVNGKEIALIVASWFISPVAGGLVTAAIFFVFEYTVHRRPEPYKAALLMAPFFYAAAVSSTLAFVLYKGVPLPDEMPEWVNVIILAGVFLIVMAASRLFIVRHVDRYIQKRESKRFSAIKEAIARELELEKSNGKGTIAELPREQNGQEAQEIELNNLKKEADSNNNNNENSNNENNNNVNNNNAAENKDAANREEIGAGEKVSNVKLEVLQNNIELEQESTRRKVEGVFMFLQFVTAPLVAFARGANDVSNGIGPLAANLAIYENGSGALNSKVQSVDWWVLLLGGGVIAVGLAVLGRRVIKSVGEKITKLTPTRGVSCEVGTALTVLVCSKLGIPISSTHTLVGCVFAVGLCLGYNTRRNARKSGEDLDEAAKKSVNWRTIGKVFLSWIVSIPLAAGVSSAAFAAFRTLA